MAKSSPNLKYKIRVYREAPFSDLGWELMFCYDVLFSSQRSLVSHCTAHEKLLNSCSIYVYKVVHYDLNLNVSFQSKQFELPF